MHADVNGARNFALAVSEQPADTEAAKEDGRSASSWRAIARRTKTKAKGLIVAPDPRPMNPYWKRHSLLMGISAEGRNEVAAVQFAVAT